jgi:GH24 family phage-related lysozyme (muramidase)
MWSKEREMKMKTSTNGRNKIKAEEGERLVAYVDSGGVLTIGVGHTSAAGLPKVTKGLKITKQESDEILARDLKTTEAEINSLVKVPLTQNQFDALVSLVFNIGGTAFKKSTLLKKLNLKDYAGAAGQFLVWNKDNGKTVTGLTNRRKREKILFETDAKIKPVSLISNTSPISKTTIRVVQERLKELGYTEVGPADGKAGKLTQTAILAFRNEHGLPISSEIDKTLLDALDDAQPRDLTRNDATAAQARAVAPEVKSNWLVKIGALITGAFGAIGSFFDGVLANLGVARTTVDNVKDYFSEIPGWTWALALVGIAGITYLIARRGEKKGVEAVQSGERR